MVKTHPIERHLQTITDREGHDIYKVVQSRLDMLHGGENREVIFGEVEQPQAERILESIAESNRFAHGELGNGAEPDEVWARSIELVFADALTADTEGERSLVLDNLLTISTMTALEAYSSESRQSSGWKTLEHFKHHFQDGEVLLKETQARAAELGLCVRSGGVDNEKFVPVSDVLSSILEGAMPAEAEIYSMLATIRNNRDEQVAWGKGFDENKLKKILQDNAYSNEALIALIEEFQLVDGERTERSPSAEKNDYRQTMNMLWDVPASRLRQLADRESEEFSEPLESLLAAAVTNMSLISRHFVLRQLHARYGSSLIATTHLARGDDPIMHALYERDDYIDVMRSSVFAGDQQTDFSSAANFNSVVTLRAKDYLALIANLPFRYANDIEFAMHQRYLVCNKEGHVDANSMLDRNPYEKALRKITNIAEVLGSDRLVQLREATGIVNLEYYSLEQLDRMSRLMAGDPELVAHFKAGDSRAVFVDAMDGHNFAFNHLPEVIDTSSGRTAFYEVHTPEDAEKYLKRQEELGIANSTWVVGAHGGEYGLGFNSGDNRFWVASKSSRIPGGGEETNQLPQVIRIEDIADGIKAMAENRMQDSRGIDDNPERTGRRSIIIFSCNQAKESRQTHVENGRRIRYVGSPVQALAAAVANSKVDVYGADQSVSIEVWGNGVRFRGSSVNPLEATLKFSFDAEEGVQAERVDHIPLNAAYNGDGSK